ncbi:MAG TPA: hypothetical protein VM869_28340, partial [Enhygromyxa sp.]|nr:hypothetical protein [Enhygromyxa sp.]
MPDPINQAHEPSSEQDLIVNGVDPINAVVVADNTPQEAAFALAVQRMAQALAIATTDATALLRTIENAMSGVQSAALTRWIEAGSDEQDPRYQAIVRAAGQVLADAVALWRDINVAAQQLLDALTDPGSMVVEAEPATPAVGKKQATKKKAAKKAEKKKTPAKK